MLEIDYQCFERMTHEIPSYPVRETITSKPLKSCILLITVKQSQVKYVYLKQIHLELS